MVGQRSHLPVPKGKVDLTAAKSRLTSWETLGKSRGLFQRMTLESNAACCRLSSTGLGTRQPPTSLASSHLLTAANSR